jgi:DNA polymerase-4
VVATASYEARQYGIRSAMSCKMAQKLCPFVIFVPPRFHVYKQVSQQIREIFSRYTDLIEPLSLDEAYLDVTFDKKDIGSAISIAKEIKQAISDELNLTASAGVSINKFVAKVASDMNKPNGLTFIGPSKIENFMEKLPLIKFHGIGAVTAKKMKLQGLVTGKDLKKLSEERLSVLFGKSGTFFYQIVRGIDNRPVRPNLETKSISAEDTFAVDLNQGDALIQQKLNELAHTVFSRAEKYKLFGRTLTLKLKFNDFKTITRNKSVEHEITDISEALKLSEDLLHLVNFEEKQLRLIGLGISNFVQKNTKLENNPQSSLF